MKQQLIDGIAKSLRDFGYPDATSEMITDIWGAYERGDESMPHDVIGMFAERQMDEIAETRPDILTRGKAS